MVIVMLHDKVDYFGMSVRTVRWENMSVLFMIFEKKH